MYDYIEIIGFAIVHRMGDRKVAPCIFCIYAIHGEKRATAPISVLPVRLAMLKKYQGLAIALFFCIWKYLCSGCMDAQERIRYAKQTGKTNLFAVQLRILG